jgi:phosphohistidine phosphatase
MKGENRTMQVYLLRHGIAEEAGPGQSDANRALTNEGRRKLRQVLQAAADAEVQPTLVLSSPLKRALQAAEIAVQILKYKNEIVQSRALTPNSSVEEAWDEIRVHRDEDSVLLVGHNPLFSELAGFLIGSKTAQIEMKKGAILRVDMESFTPHPKGSLRWYLTPKLAAKVD